MFNAKDSINVGKGKLAIQFRFRFCCLFVYAVCRQFSLRRDIDEIVAIASQGNFYYHFTGYKGVFYFYLAYVEA